MDDDKHTRPDRKSNPRFLHLEASIRTTTLISLSIDNPKNMTFEDLNMTSSNNFLLFLPLNRYFLSNELSLFTKSKRRMGSTGGKKILVTISYEVTEYEIRGVVSYILKRDK